MEASFGRTATEKLNKILEGAGSIEITEWSEMIETKLSKRHLTARDSILAAVRKDEGMKKQILPIILQVLKDYNADGRKWEDICHLIMCDPAEYVNYLMTDKEKQVLKGKCHTNTADLQRDEFSSILQTNTTKHATFI
jgi:hypothetical protein